VRQLKLSTKQICYSCHKDIGSRVLASKSLHGPVQQDDCYACHDTHGSDFTKILKKFFPPEFYMEYKTENYAICWDCHNKDMALTEVTTTLTGFRNGSRNLHFFHINQKKGRSCKACHEMHAGDQEKHIREKVPFGTGGWQLPVKFTKLATGGNCVVGCHREQTYDRETAVTLGEEAASMADRSAPIRVLPVLFALAAGLLLAIPAHGFEKVKVGDKMPAFTLKDTAGADVGFAPGQAHVIIFFKEGQNTPNALKRIGRSWTAMKDKGVVYLGVYFGKGKPEEAKALADGAASRC
jgi:predicted CXXCH cytochrome family protein